jgi:hypothetical protein
MEEADAIQDTDPHAEPSTCFGYRAQTQVALTACRSGGGARLRLSEDDLAPITTQVPTLEWHEAGRPFARLWANAPEFTLWIDEIGWFAIDRRGPSIVLPATSSGIRREARLWGVPAALCFLDRGDLPLHAAAVDINGSAVVFAAPGRHGKTTLAGAFMAAGHRLLSEDLTCIRTNSQLAVWPGPALLRVRKDVFTQLAFTRADVVDEDATRMYVMPDRDSRGTGDAVPLRALVFLRTHSSDDVELEQVSDKTESLSDLWTLSFNMPDDGDRARCFASITQLAAAVPIWNLTRPLTFASLPRVIQAIEGLVP